MLVTLVDGKAHSVDSSDAAFQTAGALAVKDARRGQLRDPARAARRPSTSPCRTPTSASVLSDLSGRRGRVTGTEPDPSSRIGMERTVVHAELPDAELVRYATSLRSITAGTGRFRREFARLRTGAAERRGRAARHRPKPTQPALSACGCRTSRG